MDIFIDNDGVIIQLNTIEKILSFHTSLKFKVSQITEISDTLLPATWKEIRAPGIAFPGIKTGTYYTSRGKEFWLLKHNDYPLRIELSNNSIKRLILGFKDHEKWLVIFNDLKEKMNKN